MNVKKTVVAVMLVSALSIGVLSEVAYLPKAFAQQSKAKIEVSEDIIAKVKKAIKDAMPNSVYEIADYSRVECRICLMGSTLCSSLRINAETLSSIRNLEKSYLSA
ncbi:hypothetical protein M3661_12805 [Paenibacillus sp. MER 180]|uniref:hypothetical protein n=1 Tax=Paenibacillus sp. MER 180 TaxID=2939570 RepID=UPI002040AF13|nr:hypothetical protein [Paenibacillus sp. MER 180]MCM3291006.1 hypothetical protein [Paenibacillus sp. MER 180]